MVDSQEPQPQEPRPLGDNQEFVAKGVGGVDERANWQQKIAKVSPTSPPRNDLNETGKRF